MNRIVCSCLFAVVTAFLSFTQPACAQGPMPTEEHQELAELAGTWDAVMKSDFGESKGTSTFKMLGGLWLISDFKMDDDSFSGHGIDGYDPAKKKFVSLWVDSVSMTPMTMEGDWDEASKTMTLTGTGAGPDGKPTTFKSVTKHPDADHMAFDMFVTPANGAETKLVHVDYTRHK